MMPSSEVIARIGERSVVATREMCREFEVLAGCVGLAEGRVEKAVFASRAWLEARSALYGGEGGRYCMYHDVGEWEGVQ